MRKPILLLFLIAMGFANHSAAQFLEKKAEGWHWYEDLPQPQKKEDKKKPPQPESVKIKLPEPKPLTPTEQLQAFKKEVESRLHLAILQPTRENVQAYQEIQKVMADRSEHFAQRWMEVVYTTPHLDYSLKHPTAQAARHVYLDEEAKKKTLMIKGLAKSHGLFFFFKASCPYCHQFAPIVKSFAQKYGWLVIPISLDGSSLPEFQDARADNGIANRLNVTSLPTLLAVNPKTQVVIPLSVGMTTHDQIEDRIRVLVQGGNLKHD